METKVWFPRPRAWPESWDSKLGEVETGIIILTARYYPRNSGVARIEHGDFVPVNSQEDTCGTG